MNLRARVSTILVAVAALMLVGLLVRNLTAGPAYQPRAKDVAGARREVPPPRGTQDERAPLPEGAGLVGGAGIVEPAQREARLAGGAAGVVERVRAKEGDRVAEGDALVDLESSVEAAAVKSAQADLDSARAALTRALNGQRVEDRDAATADASAAKARAELLATVAARTEKLFKDGAVTQEELDRARLGASSDKASAAAAEARARAMVAGSRAEDVAVARAASAAAEARLAQAQATLDRRQIRAPYAGEILQVKVRAGEYYTPGSSEAPIVLGDTSRLRARMDVDERDIGKVRLGQPAYVVADAYPNEKIRGKVAEIGRRMGRKNVRTDDPTERLDTKILEVVLDLAGAERLVPGLRVTAFIETAPAASP
jgi:multidrug resistance efflux pump